MNKHQHKHATRWTARRFMKDQTPKLFPGKHRAYGVPVLDNPPARTETFIDREAFTAWAAEFAGKK